MVLTYLWQQFGAGAGAGPAAPFVQTAPFVQAAPFVFIPPAAGGAAAFTVGTGLSQTTLFTLDQTRGFERNLPSCNEAGIGSCRRVNLNFDAFDDVINIDGTSMQRNLQSDLDINTKFFEVISVHYSMMLFLNIMTFFRHLIFLICC